MKKEWEAERLFTFGHHVHKHDTDDNYKGKNEQPCSGLTFVLTHHPDQQTCKRYQKYGKENYTGCTHNQSKSRVLLFKSAKYY